MARKYRTLDAIEEEYYLEHPEEIESYLDTLFEEYAGNLNAPSLLAALRMLARVVGVTNIADKTGMTRNGVQKALSGKGNPSFGNIGAILHAMGYRLMPEKLSDNK